MRWYDSSGKLIDQIKGKNGNMRAPDIRDAREFGFLPSVTTILDIVGKGVIVNWLQKEIARLCFTNPPHPGELEEDFVDGIMDKREADRDATMHRGAMIHRMAERYLEKRDAGSIGAFSEDEWICFRPLQDWIDTMVTQVHATEGGHANPELGFAGTIDADLELKGFGRSLVDFKTQGVKIDKRSGKIKDLVFYPEWIRQLSAYETMLEPIMDSPRGPKQRSLISVAISSDPDYPMVQIKEWSQQEIAEGWNIFLLCLKLFYLVNGLAMPGGSTHGAN